MTTLEDIQAAELAMAYMSEPQPEEAIQMTTEEL